MPIKGVLQPEVIEIDSELRLKKYDGSYNVAVEWYKNEYVYYNSEGITDKDKIPDEMYVKRMFEYLDSCGECYFIEVKENGIFIPIGDVTLKEENPPIAIGIDKYRGKGIGKKVFKSIIDRAKEINIVKIYGSIIYDYNIPSQRLHESLGFKKVNKIGNEFFYELDIN